MNIWVLAHLGDETAQRVYAAVREKYGYQHTHYIRGDDLILAPHWSFRFEDGLSIGQLQLRDGSWVDPMPGDVVFNRLDSVLINQRIAAGDPSLNQMAQEMLALLFGWLANLPCPVINPVTHRGLSIQGRGPIEWLYLAAQAGLPVRGYSFSSNPKAFPTPFGNPSKRISGADIQRRATFEPISRPIYSRQPLVDLEFIGREERGVLVAGKKILSAPEESFNEGLITLRRLSACELMQVFFSSFRSRTERNRLSWRVTGVSSFPVVKDERSIQAIVRLLEDQVEKELVR